MLATNHHSQRGKKQIVVSCQLSVVSCQWAVVSGQWMPVRGHPRCGATHCCGSVVPPNTNRSRGNAWGQPIVVGAGTPQWGHPTFAGPPEASRAEERDAGAGPPMANLVAFRRGHPTPVSEQNRRGRFPPRFGRRPGRPTEHCPVHCKTGTASGATQCGSVVPPNTNRLRWNAWGQPIVAGAGTPQWGHPTFAGPPEASRAEERDAGAGPPMANLVAFRRGHPTPVSEQNRRGRFPPRFGRRPGRPTEHCPVHCKTGTASGATQRRRGHPTPVGERNRQGRFAPRLGKRRPRRTRGHFRARLATG